MIPVETIIAFGISSFFTLLFPIILMIVLVAKQKIAPRPLLIGMLAFFVSQILLRVPILNVLSTQSWFLSFAQQQMILYLVLLSSTAGLFEESARLIGVKCFCKEQRSYRDAFSFGLGHGLCEVILLVGMSSVGNLLYCVMLQNGSMEAAFADSPDLLQQVTTALAAVSTTSIYLGIVERVSAVLFHIFAPVLIFQGVNRGHAGSYWLLAVLSHTVFNLVAVILAQYSNVWICEGVLLLLGLCALFYVLRTRKNFSNGAPSI